MADTPLESRLREVFLQPGWEGPLAYFRKCMRKSGRVTGQYKISTQEESLAVSGLLGTTVLPGRRVRAVQLDTALLNSGLACGLRAALEATDEGNFVTVQEAREARSAVWRRTLEALLCRVERSTLSAALQQQIVGWMQAQSRDFRRRGKQDSERLLREFDRAIRALEHLPADSVIGLATLANRATGDSHALDGREPAAALFYRALAHLHPEIDAPLMRGAAGLDELLEAAGIARDRTSAKVDTFGLRSADGEMDRLLVRCPTLTLTLRSIETMRGARLLASDGVVWVVENSSVFDELLERLQDVQPESRPTLLCTNGWLNLADRALLADLTAAGCEIRYSGDFDEKGVLIADHLLRRFDVNMKLWRMSVADYGTSLGPESPALGNPPVVKADQLSELVEAMVARLRAGYQEALVEQLTTDLLEGRLRNP